MAGIIVTGAEGQLGRALRRHLGERAISCGRASLDVTNAQQVRRLLEEVRPQAVVNCAAYTKVDLAEQEPELCRSINALAVAGLAEECDRIDAALVQVSTDYVFGADISHWTPYTENDPPGPQSVYARTKLEGEQHAAYCRRHFIVRTCGLYGASPRRNNFVETMLRLAREPPALRVVDDQRCTPSNADHVAQAILYLLNQDEYGTYHIVNQGETTWFAFACEIFRQMRIPVQVEPITSEQFGAAAARPRYSVLDTGKYHALDGPKLPGWKEALSEYLPSRAPDHGND